MLTGISKMHGNFSKIFTAHSLIFLGFSLQKITLHAGQQHVDKNQLSQGKKARQSALTGACFKVQNSF